MHSVMPDLPRRKSRHLLMAFLTMIASAARGSDLPTFDCGSVAVEGQPHTMTCACEATTGCFGLVLNLKDSKGLWSPVVTCSPDTMKCTSDFEYTSAEISQSESGSVYTLTAQIGVVERKHEREWQCDALGFNRQSTCLLSIIYRPDKVTCSQPQVTSTHLTVTCSSSKVYPEAMCDISQIGVSTTNTGVSTTNTALPGDPVYYRTECTLSQPLSELDSGTYSYRAILTLNVTGSPSAAGLASPPVFLKPPVVRLSGDCPGATDYLQVNTQVSCTCEVVSAGNPPGSALWIDPPNGTTIPAGASATTLKFTASASDPSPQYTCSPVSNLKSKGQDVTFKTQVAYRVTISKFTADQSTDKLEVEAGDDVTFECEADGNPEPSLSVVASRSMLNKEPMSGSSLKMRNLRCNDTDVYMCVGSNSITSEVRSETVMIYVKCPTRINRNSLSSQYEVKASSHLYSINVSVLGYPSPTKFTLSRHSTQPVPRHSFNYFDKESPFGQLTLNLFDLEQGDAGTYLLGVGNVQGQLTENAFSMRITEKDEAPNDDNGLPDTKVIIMAVVIAVLGMATITSVIIIFWLWRKRNTDTAEHLGSRDSDRRYNTISPNPHNMDNQEYTELTHGPSTYIQAGNDQRHDKSAELIGAQYKNVGKEENRSNNQKAMEFTDSTYMNFHERDDQRNNEKKTEPTGSTYMNFHERDDQRNNEKETEPTGSTYMNFHERDDQRDNAKKTEPTGSTYMNM